jgi:large subunit ribosomal protein LP2
MRHLAAYLLASLSGDAPSKEEISKILAAVGSEVDSEKLNLLMAQLEGKDLATLIAAGAAKMSAVPTGAAPAASGAAAAAAEEAKEESEEESGSDSDMGFGGLF